MSLDTLAHVQAAHDLTIPEGCENQGEGGIQKKESGRSSPKTPGAPSQQAGAVGTRTRGSIMRASPTPTYVEELREDVAAGNTGDLASCMEDQEDWTGLDTSLEESSQDGLDEMSFELDVSVNYLAEKTTCLGRFSRHFLNPHVTTNKEVQIIATRIKCNRCI